MAASEREPVAASGARRGWIVAALVVVAGFLSFGLFGEAFGGGPQGPESSSYATSQHGLAAFDELIDRTGRHTAQLRAPLTEARLDPASTVVVLDADALLRTEGMRLLAFVRAGGRLLIGGREPQSTLPALFSHPPDWSAGGSRRATPTPFAHSSLAGVRKVISAGEGEWTDPPEDGYRVALRTVAGGGLLLERSLGRGELELLADASPLQNRLLASADNAQLGLRLTGAPTRTVVFAESVHGFGESRGLTALPERWWLALAGLVLAGLLWTAARARRLGPPETEDAAAIPPRFAYVQALSLLLRRAEHGEELPETLARLRDGR